MKMFLAVAAAACAISTMAQAAFQGRDASGAASSTCTAVGAGKCTYFYDQTLNITILNNWNIGKGFWSESAAPGSAQALAASVGSTISGLQGWVLPTGDASMQAGAQNQYRSIWVSVGDSFDGLSAQFDGVQLADYWPSSENSQLQATAFYFNAEVGYQAIAGKSNGFYAVAVRPGDISVAAVPEPASVWMLVVGLGLLGAAAGWRRD